MDLIVTTNFFLSPSTGLHDSDGVRLIVSFGYQAVTLFPTQLASDILDSKNTGKISANPLNATTEIRPFFRTITSFCSVFDRRVNVDDDRQTWTISTRPTFTPRLVRRIRFRLKSLSDKIRYGSSRHLGISRHFFDFPKKRLGLSQTCRDVFQINGHPTTQSRSQGKYRYTVGVWIVANQNKYVDHDIVFVQTNFEILSNTNYKKAYFARVISNHNVIFLLLVKFISNRKPIQYFVLSVLSSFYNFHLYIVLFAVVCTIKTITIINTK